MHGIRADLKFFFEFEFFSKATVLVLFIEQTLFKSATKHSQIFPRKPRFSQQPNTHNFPRKPSFSQQPNTHYFPRKARNSKTQKNPENPNTLYCFFPRTLTLTQTPINQTDFKPRIPRFHRNQNTTQKSKTQQNGTNLNDPILRQLGIHIEHYPK